MEATGEKKPGRGGLVAGEKVVLLAPWGPVEKSAPVLEINDGALAALEAVADEMARRSRQAFRQAAMQPADDDFGKRFIEHGAVCYFNCWELLRQFLDAASPQP